jgi:YesN/AraC family two-component response regulator
LPDHKPPPDHVSAELPLVTQAKQYIENHCAENPSLQQVADALCTDVFPLCQPVRQTTGMNFSHYLAFVRVEKAKNLLLNPQYSLKEIAAELGFESLIQFTRSFNRIVGESPRAFRARLPDSVAPAG